MIEGDLRVDPRVVEGEAGRPIVDHVDLQHLAVRVDALEELTAEELHAHDGEDEPEDEADEQDVEDGWNRVHERVDDDPHALPPGYGTKGSQRAQCAKGPQHPQVLILFDQQ